MCTTYWLEGSRDTTHSIYRAPTERVADKLSSAQFGAFLGTSKWWNSSIDWFNWFEFFIYIFFFVLFLVFNKILVIKIDFSFLFFSFLLIFRVNFFVVIQITKTFISTIFIIFMNSGVLYHRESANWWSVIITKLFGIMERVMTSGMARGHGKGGYSGVIVRIMDGKDHDKGEYSVRVATSLIAWQAKNKWLRKLSNDEFSLYHLDMKGQTNSTPRCY